MLHFVPPIRLSLSVHSEMRISTFIVKFKLIHLQGLYFLSNCIVTLIQENPQKPQTIATEQINGQSQSSSSDICGELRRFSHFLRLMSNGNQHKHKIHSIELQLQTWLMQQGLHLLLDTVNKYKAMCGQRITITINNYNFPVLSNHKGKLQTNLCCHQYKPMFVQITSISVLDTTCNQRICISFSMLPFTPPPKT